MYHSSSSARYYLLFKLMVGELPGWLWNYFELLCQIIDKTCGHSDDEDDLL